MTAVTGFGDVPRFEIGDRVVANTDIGGLFRPRVRRHTPGIVIARAPGGDLEVHFRGERTELVDPRKLDVAQAD
jgi:hypothetical protein